METYLRRSVKYFIQLIVLFVILFSLMYVTGTTATKDQSVTQMLISQRGMLLAVVVVVLSLLYPRFGFVRRQIKGNIAMDKDKIVQVFAISGYELEQTEEKDKMSFRADNVAKKILTIWEDRIVLTQTDENIVVDGIRKEVVKIEFRLKASLQNDENQ